MQQSKVTRRRFLEIGGAASALTVTAACAAAPQASPVVNQSPEVTTATAPALTTAPAEAPAGQFGEAPMLAEMVQAGSLPPVEERLPAEPMVVPVAEEIGQYGGSWRRCAVGPSDVRIDNRLSYECLVRWAPDGSALIPNVAKAYEVSDDATEFTFYLREGMKWSDGEPFTADDYLFWYEDILLNTELTPSISMNFRDPANSNPMAMTKLDDYAFRVVFETPNGLFLQVLAGPDARDILICAPKHYMSQFHPRYANEAELEKAVSGAGFDNWWELFAQKQAWDNPERPVIWAWKPTRVPPDIPVVCDRNPYYWKVDPEGNQLPYIDEMVHDVVENADLLNLKAVAGEIDMQFRHIMWNNYPLFLENAEQGDYRVLQWTLAEGSNCGLYPNLNHLDPGLRELLGNLEFRIALSHGINRSEINELAYQGMGIPRQASVIPECPYFREEHGSRYAEHDPDKSNELLDALGMTERDPEGFRTRLDGSPLTLGIDYSPVFGPWRDAVQIIIDQWKDIGIRAVPRELDRTLHATRCQANEHDISVWTQDYCYIALVRPHQFVPYDNAPATTAVLWTLWWSSGGKEGEEPPEEVREQYELYDRIRGARPEELDSLAEAYFENASRNLWIIGTVGALPAVGIVKNSFRNVPETAVSDWLLLSPGNTATEQYFIRQA